MPTADLPGLDLHFEQRGDGPALLLIAGIPAIADDWGPLLDRLAGARRVIAFDNRGSGRSTVTPGPYTTAQLAADAVALLDHLGVDHADVFGMSLGGMIAQELALARPERVRALVLGCTHAGVRHAAPQPQEAARAFAMRTDDWALRMRTLAPFAFSPGVDPELLRAFVEKKSRDVQAEEGYRAQIAAVLSHDTAGRLAGVSARTLVVTGDDDRIIPAASSHRLHERIPDATLKVVAGAGHIFFWSAPTRRSGCCGTSSTAALTATLSAPADRPLGRGASSAQPGHAPGLGPAARSGGRECHATQADTKVLGRSSSAAIHDRGGTGRAKCSPGRVPGRTRAGRRSGDRR